MEQINLIKIHKKNVALELRTNFGRKKTAVMTKGGEYFYMNLYDNSPRYKENKMFLGFDELNELCQIKEAMETTRGEFKKPVYMPMTEPINPAKYYQHSSRPATYPFPDCDKQYPSQMLIYSNMQQMMTKNSTDQPVGAPIPVIVGQKRKNMNVDDSEIPFKKVRYSENIEGKFENISPELLNEYLL